MCLLVCRQVSAIGAPAADCEAYFSYSSVQGSPLSIQFWDGSNTPSITYLWEFGDNTTSEEQNPMHEYNQPGIYEVCLYISDATKSCFDVYCKTILVPIPTECGASFLYEQDGSNLLQYHFQSMTGSDIDSLWWNFGDGFTSTNPNPSHTYNDTGTYIVTLNAKNVIAAELCWATYSDTIVCQIEECKSKFEIQPHPINPFIYNFNSASQGSLNLYHWDFGDGRQSFETNPIHTYNDTGTFVIKLKVSNTFFPEYCSDSSEQSVHISLIPCQSIFTYLQDTTNPLSFKFTNQSSGPGDEWIWTFGDGNGSADINPTHLYNDTGTFEVCLTIRNSQYPDYCNDQNCISVNIDDLGCSAEFTYTQDTNNILAVAFSTINQGPANTFTWSFGDDAVSTLSQPIHQYSDTGWYEVKHAITNTYFSHYCDDIRTDSIYLGFLHYPHADFDYVFDSLSTTPNLFTFIDRSTGTNITNWRWTFGDGTEAYLQNPLHNFNQTNSFSVCLEVSDSIPPQYQLKSQQCKVIQTHRYFDLGGSIYDSPVPINNPNPEGDTARVTLYRLFSNNNIIPITSGYFSNLGYYYFQNVLEGQYLVSAILTDFSRQAGHYFPTWSRESITWTQATAIELTRDIFSQDIVLQPIPTFPTGLCGIDGIVLRVDDPSATTGISEPDVIVYLTDSQDKILNYNLSDITGRFLFRNLPTGEYKLKADHPGYLSTTETTSLTTENPFGGNLRVRIYKETGIGFEEVPSEKQPIVVNNPFSNQLTISLMNPYQGSTSVFLYNAMGQPVVSIQAAGQYITINTTGLPAGVYLLQINNQSFQTFTQKLLKF